MRRTSLTLLGAAAAAAFTLAACGGDDSASTPSAGGPTDGATGSALVVKGEDQLKFDKTAYTAEAGEIDVTYENAGGVAHTLLIDGVKGFKLAISGGGTDEGTVDLEPGTYKLYCDLAGHEAAGMVAQLTVT